MTTLTWPTTFSRWIERDDLEIEHTNPKDEYEATSGIGESSLRHERDVTMMAATWKFLSHQEYLDFRHFYNVVLGRGVNEFKMANPLGTNTTVWRILGSPKIQIETYGPVDQDNPASAPGPICGSFRIIFKGLG